ncbi:hypothetical protein C478_17356 [Natrinema thermotolerans DSM 11552]|nr:hypothetical protein C478_17356 [Natrinema thermotolerans DSM 11552]
MALREREQWICWQKQDRDGKATKVPIVPGTGDYASATDPATWRSFEDALEYATSDDAAGIGFVFTDEDPFVGVDLDDCRDPETGSPSDTAREIIVDLESFTEVSPSGTGYHVIVRGSIPGDRSRRGSVEMYETARFFTVTGDHVEATPERITDRPAALESVYDEYIADDSSDRAAQAAVDDTAGDSDRTDVPTEGHQLEDEELLERARAASNGEKFDRLWRGSTAGYESQSEADMALCCLLAFWTGGDPARVDRLFRQSGLLRDKWDDVHYADGSTYGEKTVERAIARTDDVYEPSSNNETQSTADQQRPHTASRDSARERSAGTSDVSGGDDGTRAAYLAEKNQLLRARVAELEATIERKNDRIADLEGELERLEAELATRETPNPSGRDEPVESAGDHGDQEPSVWDRTKQLFQSDTDR